LLTYIRGIDRRRLWTENAQFYMDCGESCTRQSIQSQPSVESTE